MESLWYARGTIPYRRERIAPTGSAVAVIVLGDPIIQTPDAGEGPAFVAHHGSLIGPHDRPIVNEPTGPTFALGIVTTSVGCEAVFGVPPGSIRGRVVDLVGVWSAARALRQALLDEADPEKQLDLVGAVVESSAHLDPDATFARCEEAVRLLEIDPTRPVAEIAQELGVSHTRLDRDFRRIVGLSPRSLARLLRLRRLLGSIAGTDGVRWAEVAQDFGWYDQSHLIRDFRRHTGVTPTDYVRAQAAFSTTEAADAPGFVPEGRGSVQDEPTAAR